MFANSYELLQPHSTGEVLLISKAFLKGLWFDNVTCCYISIVPLLIMSICGVFNINNKLLLKFCSFFISIFYCIAFSLSAANVPYFEYFFKNINSSIFNWTDQGGTTFSMMFGEITYLLPIAIFLFIAYGFTKFSFLLLQIIRTRTENNFRTIIITSFISVIMIGLTMFGIRGRIGYNPIKVSAAYYCDDPFLNQLGINPAFNLLITYLDDRRSENKKLDLVEEEIAFDIISKQFNINVNQDSKSIARFVRNDNRTFPKNENLYKTTDNNTSRFLYEKITTLNSKPNVVLIFMESMSASFLKRFGQEKNVTPFIDSLYNHSIAFDNFYSSGIHTNHGVFSSLYSFPTIMRRNAMKGSNIPNYSGLPTVLKENGYYNMFFMTHESQYDNMNAFLRTNGYDDIYAQENYPKEKVVNSFGVSDDFLFEYSLNKINEISKNKQPFFATLLTIANHPPYVIPENFKSKDNIEDTEYLIVEYADQCINDFFKQASKEDWYDNTVFVLLADHGKIVGTPTTEMPISYNHIPLLIYSPLLKQLNISNYGNQIDLAPTLLSLLSINYTQVNLGINLFAETRDVVYYTSDNLVCTRDSSKQIISEPATGAEYMYVLDNHGNWNKIKEDSLDVEIAKEFEKLKNFGYSHLQFTETIIQETKNIVFENL